MFVHFFLRRKLEAKSKALELFKKGDELGATMQAARAIDITNEILDNVIQVCFQMSWFDTNIITLKILIRMSQLPSNVLFESNNKFQSSLKS